MDLEEKKINCTICNIVMYPDDDLPNPIEYKIDSWVCEKCYEEQH